MFKLKKRKFLKVEATFLDEILELGIAKCLGFVTNNTLTMKGEFERNKNIFRGSH